MTAEVICDCRLELLSPTAPRASTLTCTVVLLVPEVDVEVGTVAVVLLAVLALATAGVAAVLPVLLAVVLLVVPVVGMYDPCGLPVATYPGGAPSMIASISDMYC